MDTAHRIVHFLRHNISAIHTHGHGVHSPFLYEFIQNILHEKYPYYCFSAFEQQRAAYLNDPTAIDVYDVGTGGASGHVFSTYPPTTGADGRQAPLTIRRQIQQIASRALKPAPQAQLLFRMCARLGYKKVLELGTSLGITTLYLSAASKQITCTSVEGCPNIASIASKTLLKHGYHNANIVNTNLNSGLLNLLNNIGIQDIIFIDANHSYQALTDYFNQCVNFIHTNSIIVVDDPYWSREMTKAWNELRRHNKVTATLDIYHMGFVFFNPAFANKHYRIRF